MACGARSGLKPSLKGGMEDKVDGLNGLWSPFGIETQCLTTVALLFGEEQGSLPGSSTRQAARRDELAEPQQPAPTRQWSAPRREQDAGRRRGYGCADAPARPLS